MAIPDKMTATVLVAPHRFELQERPVPVPGRCAPAASEGRI